jgi:hypothetical protein
MFGRPLVEPIDDLAAAGDPPAVLVLLADDFVGHGYDFRRLLRTIASLEAFRLDSAVDSGSDEEASPSEVHEELWASFPLTRLRPEQVAGSLFQAATLGTLGPESPWVIRFLTYTGRNDFVRRYGDAGEDELEPHEGRTIPQSLLLMNGELVKERTKDDFFTASSRIASLAPTDEKAVEVAYLTVLTRRPTPEEAEYFVSRLKGAAGQERKERLTDLFWTLLNASEFSWNH